MVQAAQISSYDEDITEDPLRPSVGSIPSHLADDEHEIVETAAVRTVSLASRMGGGIVIGPAGSGITTALWYAAGGGLDYMAEGETFNDEVEGMLQRLTADNIDTGHWSKSKSERFHRIRDFARTRAKAYFRRGDCTGCRLHCPEQWPGPIQTARWAMAHTECPLAFDIYKHEGIRLLALEKLKALYIDLTPRPNRRLVEVARRANEAGVKVIVGAHSHVAGLEHFLPWPVPHPTPAEQYLVAKAIYSDGAPFEDDLLAFIARNAKSFREMTDMMRRLTAVRSDMALPPGRRLSLLDVQPRAALAPEPVTTWALPSPDPVIAFLEKHGGTVEQSAVVQAVFNGDRKAASRAVARLVESGHLRAHGPKTRGRLLSLVVR